MAMKQNFPHVVLEEKDVPGACITPLKDISSNTSVCVKRWLATIGFTKTGKKADSVAGYIFFLVQAIEYSCR